MAESLKDKVAIIGMGCTPFGELWDVGIQDMILEAANEAFDDAGVEAQDIDAAWFGAANPGIYTGQPVASALNLQYIPITHVENMCATGAESMRGAALGLASKTYDLCLSVGVEKLKDEGFGGIGAAWPGEWHPLYGASIEIGGGPGRYALAATRYFSRYGLSREEGKMMLAKISVNSHHNGARNPKAHLRNEVTLEQVLNAPMIAWPLGLFDCCGVTDGAAVAVMCRAEDAKKYKPSGEYTLVKGFGLCVGPGWGKEDTRYDYTHWEETERAAKMAYDMAGIKDPRKELDMVELHDCFSIASAIATESLGLCPKGRVKEDIDAGSFTQEGDLPINLSGGLKSFGHPIGASGAREVYEIYNEILGRAQDPSRQLPNIKLGLAHNQGGHPGMFMAGITIIGAP